jgi:6,7-dimethyl-8-ribityllumazine synthase
MQHAPQSTQEPFDASAWKIGIVVAQFNRHITQALQNSAVARAAAYNIAADAIDIIEVAGAVEIPLALQQLAKTGKYNAVVAIGCVIKGETPHFDYVCDFVTQGILRVQLDNHLPIGFGVLTCNTEAEALARTTLGADHLDAALQLAKQL